MKFTTPCFVRVEDAQEQNSLTAYMESINRRTICTHNEECCYLCVGADDISMWMALRGESTIKAFEKEAYNCGSNIPLFKALAAKNDENNREQMFVCTITYTDPYLDYAAVDRGDIAKWGEFDGSCITHWRKATVSEIIEYFK